VSPIITPAPKPRKPEDAAFAKVLVHGPAGNGKTHFLGTAQSDERTFPMAFLNWDAGESSLAGLDIDVFDAMIDAVAQLDRAASVTRLVDAVATRRQKL